jgi:hypothetical protein
MRRVARQFRCGPAGSPRRRIGNRRHRLGGEIHTDDALRRATFEQVEAFHFHLRSAYLQLGYGLIELPKISASGRAELITKHVHLGAGTLRPEPRRSA